MFAVTSISGKQYKVSPKDIIVVGKLAGEIGSTVTFTQVHLMESDGKVSIGTPNVRNAVVTAKILSQEKGEKVSVRRFKSKVRYRKAIGFRPQVTRIEILSVGRS
jgi:large subunit ribosomal protein L21